MSSFSDCSLDVALFVSISKALSDLLEDLRGGIRYLPVHGEGQQLTFHLIQPHGGNNSRPPERINCEERDTEQDGSRDIGHRELLPDQNCNREGELILARISDFAVVPYRQDQSPRLDFWGSDARNLTTEGDTRWVNYNMSHFSSRSTAS